MKYIENIKKINKNKKKGFTLVEVLVAMFIFVLMMSTSSTIFAKLFNSYRDAKDLQQDIDNANFAMNSLMKSLRTSSVVENSSDQSITIFDYSQNVCITYRFNASSNEMEANKGGNDFNICQSAGPSGTYNSLTSGNVAGKFISQKSVDGSTVGKVTLLLKINEGDIDVNMQSTVSLRDYTVSAIEIGS